MGDYAIISVEWFERILAIALVDHERITGAIALLLLVRHANLDWSDERVEALMVKVEAQREERRKEEQEAALLEELLGEVDMSGLDELAA